MGLAPQDPATRAFYQNEAADYAGGVAGTPSRHLAAFLARLPDGASVLELGCGSGRDAAAMIAAGFEVDATDASPAMLAQAEALVGAATRQMRFEDLQAQAAYDGIFANASLLHVPRAALPGILGRIHTALRPGGWHLASFKSGEAEGRDAHGRFFNYPDADWLRSAYAAAGFRIEELIAYRGGSYGGAVQDWLAITVQR